MDRLEHEVKAAIEGARFRKKAKESKVAEKSSEKAMEKMSADREMRNIRAFMLRKGMIKFDPTTGKEVHFR